ncbi:MAG: hypothetical protein ACO3PY_02545 [Pontimonas sp.]
MTKMYLRNKKDGFIYGWNEILAQNPLCEPVTEEEAYPERFIKPEQVEKVKKTRARRKTKALDLSTEDTQEEPNRVAPEIEADASRDLLE